MEGNLFIIHGFHGLTPIIKEYIEPESKKLGIETYVPIFPKEIDADFNKWKNIMDTYYNKGLINENTIIIAHSIGAVFIPKYLAEKNIKIKLFISMAGFLRVEIDREDLKQSVKKFLPVYEEINKSIELMPNRYAIYSNNDHLFSREILEEYADKFQSNKVFIHNVGHMGRKSGIKELPEVIEITKLFM